MRLAEIELPGRELVTTLLLIRHGLVDTGPPPGRLCGSLDVPLSAAGRAQLRTLLERRARRETPAALFASTLSRAQEVARALGDAWGLEARAEAGLREIDCGRFEGVRLEDLQRAHPQLWARNLAQRDDGFAWPGGESYREFRARVLQALGRIAGAYRGELVAVVTHAGVIAQAIGTIRGRPAAAWEPDRPDALTATEIAWSGGRPQALVSFNRADWY
jgi:alpha-ribazole phosphatase/probable phosphoglycerate mutase